MEGKRNYLQKKENETSQRMKKLEYCMIYWLINSDGISTCPGLFHAMVLGNRVYCTFIFTFFV